MSRVSLVALKAMSTGVAGHHAMVRGYDRVMHYLARLCVASAILGLGSIALAQETSDKPASQQENATTKEQSKKAQRGPGLRFGIAQPPAKTPGAVRIACYNLQNLMDHTDDPSLAGEWDDMKLAVSDDRAKALAKVIKQLDADVLLLEEIESKEALTWFRDTYLKDLGYTHLESLDAGYYRGVEQSILSRFPLSNPRVFLDAKLSTKGQSSEESKEQVDGSKAPDDATKFQRSPLAVDVDFPRGYSLTVYSIHHKAGGEKFNAHREAEAAKVIELMRADMKAKEGRNMVVMGDFNATPNAESRKQYTQAGFLNGYDYRPAADRAAERDQSLPKSAREALREKYTTHESGRPIDYILVSPSFAEEIVPGSFFVLSSLHPGDAYNWKTDQPPSGYASDHYPLALEFTPQDKQAKSASDNSSAPKSSAPKGSTK